MTAGKGDDDGLRAARVGSDAAAHELGPETAPGGSTAEPVSAKAAPTDDVADSARAAANSVTQQLPVVRHDGSPDEGASVRAVARRAASALPAIGRDEVADAPRSARLTAGRRRRAAAEAGNAEAPVPAEPAAEASEPVLRNSGAPTEAAEPFVDTAAEAVLAVELVIEPLPAEAAPAPVIPRQVNRGVDLEIVPAAMVRSRTHETPVSRGGEVTPTEVMGQPATPAGGDVLDAEIVDEPGAPSRTSVNLAAAEMLSTLTEGAFLAARTDEWAIVQPITEPRSAGDLVRPGPGVLEADSWDQGLLPAIEQDSYQGRRRAGVTSARLWVVIGLVIAALSTAIAVPFLLTSGSPKPAAQTPDAQAPVVGPAGPSDASTSADNTSPSPAALPAVGASPLVTRPPTPSPTPPPGPFSLAIQAEQGGDATAWGGTSGPPRIAAGATVIDEIGDDWVSGPGTNNWLEFRNIVVPAPGQYRVTIWYVYGLGPTGTRRMSVIVNGATTSTQVFSTTTTVTAREVTVNLATTNTIRLTHLDSRSPAVDRIEIVAA
jgi:hypothetical protein